MSTYTLLVFDCDGTFLNDAGEVLDSTKQALRKCSEKGIKIAFASGRAKEGIENVIKKIQADNLIDYYICHNGARIYDADEGRYLADKHLVLADYPDLLKLAEGSELGFYAFANGQILAYNQDDAYADEEAGKNSVPVNPMADAPLETQIYKFVIPGSPEKLDRLQDSLPEEITEQYSVVRSAQTNLEFLHPDASKGIGIQMLCDSIGYNVEQALPFGDAQNDYSMYEATGNMIAMGNAQSCLKDIATMITDDNNHDGIARAIKTIVL